MLAEARLELQDVAAACAGASEAGSACRLLVGSARVSVALACQVLAESRPAVPRVLGPEVRVCGLAVEPEQEALRVAAWCR